MVERMPSVFSPATRLTVGVMLGALVLTGCGSEEQPVAEPALPSASLPTSSGSATPAVSAPPDPAGKRTVESLAAQLTFTAPALPDPVVAEAVTAYESFIRNFVVAQGLPDRDYAPLLATIDVAFVEPVLKATRQDLSNGYIILGPFTETVQEAAGSASAVYLTSCSDYRDRRYYLATDGAEAGNENAGLLPVLVTMIKPTDTWLIANYTRAKDVPCT